MKEQSHAAFVHPPYESVFQLSAVQIRDFLQARPRNVADKSRQLATNGQRTKTLEELLPFATETNARSLAIEEALSYNIYRDSKLETRRLDWKTTSHPCVRFLSPAEAKVLSSLDHRGHEWQPPKP